MTSKSSYPIFDDGDIGFLISPDVYSLHSSVLRTKSAFVDNLCTQGNHESGKSGSMNMLRLVLVPSAVHDRGVFEPQTQDSYNHHLETVLTGTGKMWPETLRKAWSTVFRIFYAQDTLLDTSGPTALSREALEIIQVAEALQLNATSLKQLEAAILAPGQATLHAVVSNPILWSNMGKRVRSAVLYQEAVIHLVGRWNALTRPALDFLSHGTLELCKKKFQELHLKKKTVECRMSSYYPQTMHRGADGNLGGASYASDIYTWMAVAFYRQWLSFCIIDRRNYVAADGGAAFYRMIGRVDAEGYLGARELAYFNLAFPMSSRGRMVFESKLRELKVDMRDFVSELLVNRSRLRGVEVPYLTCCQVDREDLPWDEHGPVEEYTDGIVRTEAERPAGVAAGGSPPSSAATQGFVPGTGNIQPSLLEARPDTNNMPPFPGSAAPHVPSSYQTVFAAAASTPNISRTQPSASLWGAYSNALTAQQLHVHAHGSDPCSGCEDESYQQHVQQGAMKMGSPR